MTRRPAVVVFDVNETLSDMAPLSQRFRERVCITIGEMEIDDGYNIWIGVRHAVTQLFERLLGCADRTRPQTVGA